MFSADVSWHPGVAPDHQQPNITAETKGADYSSIPGFDKVIENISNLAIENNKTPLKELEKIKLSNDN